MGQAPARAAGIGNLLRLIFTFALLGSAAWGLRTVFKTLGERFIMPLFMPTMARLSKPLNDKMEGDSDESSEVEDEEEGEEGDETKKLEDGTPSKAALKAIADKPKAWTPPARAVKDEVASLKDEVASLVKMVKQQGDDLKDRFDKMSDAEQKKALRGSGSTAAPAPVDSQPSRWPSRTPASAPHGHG